MTEPAKVSRHVLIDNCDLTSVPAPTPPVTANSVNGAVVYVDDWNRAQHARAMLAAQEAAYTRILLACEKRFEARFALLEAALGRVPPSAAKAQVGVVTDVALRPDCDATKSAQVADQVALAEVASSRKNGAWFPCGEAPEAAPSAP